MKIADFGACVILNQDDEEGRDGDISSGGDSGRASHASGARDRDRRKVRKNNVA